MIFFVFVRYFYNDIVNKCNMIVFLIKLLLIKGYYLLALFVHSLAQEYTLYILLWRRYMLKKLMVGAVLLSASLSSQAGIISSITGADMTGISVTATFADFTSETLLWNPISTTLGTSGNNIIDHEGFSGGVFGTDWSLIQQGYTLGEYDGSNTYGAWSFTDNKTSGSEITSIVIDASNTGIIFDTEFISDLSLDTNGSSQGRAVTGILATIDNSALFTGSYSNNYQEELFSTLTIDFISPGTSFQFLADTDVATVSEPATALVFITGLLALVNFRRKS